MTITEAKRKHALGVLQDAFAKFRTKPADAGHAFQRRWRDSASQLSDELAYLGDILWAISNSLTQKSSPVFADKVRSLLRSRTDNEYSLCLAELEVAAILASRASPIAFEPVVPLGASPAAKPRSSDYSVTLPSGEIIIEATTIDLQETPINAEVVFERMKRKLQEKRQQAFRDRVYLLVLKVLGPAGMFDLVREEVNERAWPNRRFSRYGGIFIFAGIHGNLGAFRGAWVPNHRSAIAPANDVHDLFSGRRCFHLHPVENLKCSLDELHRLRRRVAAAWSEDQVLGIPVRLVDGPLDGLKTLLKPTQLGDRQVTFRWELKGAVKNKNAELMIPPHGPVQVVYQRRTDTRYDFKEFRFWIDEIRPAGRRAEYLVRLRMVH